MRWFVGEKFHSTQCITRSFRNQVETAPRAFKKPNSNEVYAAERNYARALIAATHSGSPDVRGSDVWLDDSPSVRVNFVRDEANFMVQFVSGEQQHAASDFFTHAAAVEVGTRVEATGSYERCPVTVCSKIRTRNRTAPRRSDKETSPIQRHHRDC